MDQYSGTHVTAGGFTYSGEVNLKYIFNLIQPLPRSAVLLI